MRWAVTIVLLIAWTASARAQDEATVHIVWHAEGGPSETWAGLVVGRLADDQLETRPDDAWSRTPADQTEAHDALVRVESGLAGARAAMRELDEHGALTLLAAARADATRSLSLPGTVAWAAEVELATGRAAAQAGQLELARASFARAFAIVPTRNLGAAEAAPDVVALARDVMATVGARPAGRFDLSVAWDDDALVYLDDQPLGRAPRRIETRAGAHVLRVEAEGAEPYAAWIDVLPGTRPPISVTLSPTPLAAAVQAAHAAVLAGELDVLPARVRAIEAVLGEPTVVWIVEGRLQPFQRAVVTPCDRDACHSPARLETGTRESPYTALDARPIDAASRRAALAWRDEELPVESGPPPTTDPWTEAWPWALVGTGVALVLGGVITGIVLATQPPPDQLLVIDVTLPH
jgi:hypothetical protein